jgi:DNA-binding HxlR family transcriptional regulator
MSNISKEDVENIVKETMTEQMEGLYSALNSVVTSVRRDFKLNYLNLIARSLEAEAKENINSFQCAFPHAQEKKCKNTVNTYISKYTRAIASGDIEGAFDVLDDLEDAADTIISKMDDTANCKSDWLSISKIVKRHKDIAQSHAQFSSSSITPNLSDLDFDTEELYENFIFPMSHTLRIQIVHALVEGPKRFTELKDMLDVKNTGLLVHHLKPLTEAGFIAQDYKKEYNLTDRGVSVARELGKVSKLLNPERDVLPAIEDAIPTVKQLRVINQSKS